MVIMAAPTDVWTQTADILGMPVHRRATPKRIAGRAILAATAVGP
jgi:hypothetical protein